LKTVDSHLKYAKALFRVAEKKEQSGVILAELEKLSRFFHEQNFIDLMRKISFARHEIAEKILDQTFHGHVHELNLNLLKLLARSRKLLLLPKIYESYKHLYHEAKGIDELEVRTARKLDTNEQQALIEKLQHQRRAKTGVKAADEITVRFEQQPELIGGLQIYENGFVQDFSVQNYLHLLEKFLLKPGDNY